MLTRITTILILFAAIALGGEPQPVQVVCEPVMGAIYALRVQNPNKIPVRFVMRIDAIENGAFQSKPSLTGTCSPNGHAQVGFIAIADLTKKLVIRQKTEVFQPSFLLERIDGNPTGSESPAAWQKANRVKWNGGAEP